MNKTRLLFLVALLVACAQADTLKALESPKDVLSLEALVSDPER